ncbi:MAG: hypothetical protein GY751_25950 [Bacteroidetes bacterium]|nr:hypothetical protein [Bacteroidota bacterium]
MPSRFVYHERIQNSKWPFLFKVLGATSYSTTDVIPSKDRVDTFENLMEADVEADKVARDLFMSSRPHGQSFKLMNRVLENGLEGVEDVQDSFRNLMEDVHREPDWLNRVKLERFESLSAFRKLGNVSAW